MVAQRSYNIFTKLQIIFLFHDDLVKKKKKMLKFVWKLIVGE